MASTKPRHPKTCLVSFGVTKSLYWTLYSLTRSGTAFSDSWLLMWWKHTHLHLWFLQPETCSFFRISFFWAKKLMLLIGMSKCRNKCPLSISGLGLAKWWKHVNRHLRFLQKENRNFFRISFFWSSKLMLLIGISKCYYKWTSPFYRPHLSSRFPPLYPLGLLRGVRSASPSEREDTTSGEVDL